MPEVYVPPPFVPTRANKAEELLSCIDGGDEARALALLQEAFDSDNPFDPFAVRRAAPRIRIFMSLKGRPYGFS